MIFTIHAIQRMKQRGITIDQVKSCLEKPDKIIENEVLKAIKKIDNKILVVCYKKAGEEAVIITAYITSKIKKYL
ncbi:MAG: hypothetical protein DRJ36_01225 [Thermoprotei archaeon]|nr:MAG: hypothetical protein DRJ36_01225 [Thermoprotei archaeon]